MTASAFPRIYALLAAIATVAVVLTGCRPSDESTRAPGLPSYVTTIPPLARIVEQIVGDRATVHSLLARGASPHTYEPLPSDAASVEKATALLYVSEELDAWAASLPARSKVRVIDFLPESERLHFAEGGDDHDHDHHGHSHGPGVVDPHFWVDPVAIRSMVPGLLAEMIRLDPEGKATYETNAAKFVTSLGALDAELRTRLEPVRGRAVVLYHPSICYMLKRYGIEYIGALELSPGKEATPTHISGIVKQVKDAGVRALFSEPQLPIRAVHVVAEAANISVFELDPIGGVEGRMTLNELLLFNADVLAKALR